jgi:hypothetical protein
LGQSNQSRQSALSGLSGRSDQFGLRRSGLFDQSARFDQYDR